MTGAVESLIEAGRAVVDAGLSPGSSGNISVREGERILMSGTGSRLGALAAADIAVLAADGSPVEGARPSKEVPLHTALYRKNPEHTAVVHVHSPSAVALSCLVPWSDESAIPPLTPYALMRIGQVPLIPFAPPGHPDMGRFVSESAVPFRAALLANHGAVVSGANLERAVDGAIELEEACRIALLTNGCDRRLIPFDEVRALCERHDTPWTGAAYGR